MPRPCSAALCRLAAAAPTEPAADPQLLRAYLSSRSEAAFAELVRRHGPMVLAVCRRVLGHAQDAEDAFQAAFLVLARRAGTIRGANLAGWLYGVAVRTARGVRIMRDRRQKYELASGGRQAPDGRAHQGPLPASHPRSPDGRAHQGPPPASHPRSPEDAELVAILDEELAFLPEYYRLPVVLCELQGRSRKEAAAELNIPEGTLSSRLAAAKKKLADRLTRRGVTATAVAAAFADHAAARVPGHLARAAAGALPGSVAARVADGVVKSLFVAQLKGAVVAVGLAVGLVGGAVLVSDGPGGSATAAVADPKPADKPGPTAEKLVKQLGDPDFKTREDAGKKLRGLGSNAIPVLTAATRDPNPEIARRAADLLATVRADARAELAKRFDPAKTEEYDHPVWKRYVKIVGDSPASRDLFARIIANPKWFRTLDAAEADPAGAGHVYRVGIAEMFRDFDRDPAESPPWPCDRVEEVAYLLLLGSHPDPHPPAELTGDEIPPKTLRNTAFLGRGIIHGEEQIIHARGLEIGLEGKWLVWQKLPAAAGTDRVFRQLFAAWFAQRDPASPVVLRGLRIAGQDLLPFARRIAANDFEPKRQVPPLATITALEMVARFGTRADLPLFERYFGDETNAAAADKARTDGARDYYRPAPVIDTTQFRDVALGLALLLYGASPADFGFIVREEAFKLVDGKYLVPGFIQLQLGFKTEADRATAFKKAKAWLAEQKKPVEKAAPIRTETMDDLIRRFDPTGTADYDHPVWKRFKAVAGDDRAARALFSELIRDPARAKVVDAAVADPEKAGAVYAAEIGRQKADHDRAAREAFLTGTAPCGDFAAVLLIGTFPTSAKSVTDPAAEVAVVNAGLDRAGSRFNPPLRKLFAAWVGTRGHWATTQFALELWLDLPECLPVARRIAADKTRPVEQRVSALQIVSKHGDKSDLPLLEPLRDDKTIFRPLAPKAVSGGPTIQARDVAAAVALRLHGRDPEDFGFRFNLGSVPEGRVWFPLVAGFATDADRAAAHKKAKAWLAEQKKPDSPKK